MSKVHAHKASHEKSDRDVQMEIFKNKKSAEAAGGPLPQVEAARKAVADAEEHLAADPENPALKESLEVYKRNLEKALR